MKKKIFKRVIIDAVGYLLVALGIILMPVPGPGGLPVMLAGLGLLSIENNWAKSCRQWLLDNGHNLAAKFFPKNKSIQLIYDLLAAIILSVSLYITIKDTSKLVGMAATLGISGSLMILGFNCQRLDRFLSSLKRKS
jgi:uncharacterized protein (TIGR02611 family)